MTEDFIKREEYNASIGRIHDQVNEIKTSVIRTEESVKHSEDFMKDIHKVLYGNGGDGFLTRVDKKFAQLFERIGLHSKLITLIMFSILGIAFFIIRQGLAINGK